MRLKIFLGCLSMCLLNGCYFGLFERKSTPNAELGNNSVFHNAGEHGVTLREYRIDPPDEIVIRAPKIPELDGQRRTVQTNGKIPLPLLGEVNVTGLTPDEAAKELMLKVSKFYVNPDIHLEVLANSKFYYVFGGGAVKPGRFPYAGRVTVVSALAEAGFNPAAWPEQVRLSRPGRNGAPNATAIVDFTKVWDSGNLQQNYLLEDGDIIYLPITPLAAWGFATSELLSPLLNTTALITAGGSIVRPGGI